MADEYVRMEQFGEFVKRIDERFAHANELADQRFDSLNRRFADAEKAREQNLGHINQRFDSLERRMDQLHDPLHADMRQMRNGLCGFMAWGSLASSEPLC